MSFDAENATVKELLTTHKFLRNRFDENRQRLTEVTLDYRVAKTELVDFQNKFGRIIALFEDS